MGSKGVIDELRSLKEGDHEHLPMLLGIRVVAFGARVWLSSLPYCMEAFLDHGTMAVEPTPGRNPQLLG